MAHYIPYIRVSTVKQKRTGLGLEDQDLMIKRFLRPGDTVSEPFIEIESGKNNNRVELNKAINETKVSGGRLLVAKLDRLSRDLEFICHLQNTEVRFTVCDMPEANEISIHFMGAFAQWERKKISERTTAALGVIKRSGRKLGVRGKQNFSQEGRLLGSQNMRKKALEDIRNVQAYGLAKALRKSNMTYVSIADELNSSQYVTTKGNNFTEAAVKNLFKLYK